MRLVCPNCGAQYDVPLEVIPEAGRDVQCSNCGHTWFQRRVQQPATMRETPLPAQDSEQEALPPSEPPVSEPPVSEPPATAPDPAQTTTPKRSIDPEMAELFREEREYEERQRSAGTLETQPDLGLESPRNDNRTPRPRPDNERIAQPYDDDDEAAPAPPTEAATDAERAPSTTETASRRDLLPNVDEINQTLRASSKPRVELRSSDSGRHETAPRETGSPFARGFMLMVLLAVLAVAAYVFAPRLSVNVPMAAPYLETYVESVDAGRGWLDGQVTSLLQSLDQMSSETGAPGPAGD